MGSKKSGEKKKIKICHVATVAGSLYVLLLNQLRYLRDECGYEVQGVAADDEWTNLLRKSGFPVHLASLKRKISLLSDIKAFFQLYSLFRKEKFDIVHVHTPKAALLGSLAAWVAKIPIRVNTIHGFYFHKGSSKFKYYFFWLLEFIISRCIHYALSQNSEDYAMAIQTHLYEQDTISFLGNGIDLDHFKPEPDFKSEVRADLGISGDSYVLGVVGRLTHEKGYREFLTGLNILVRSNFPVEGVIIGTSERRIREFYLELIKELGIEDKIKIIGWRDNIERFYHAFDLFILPSYREGFPRSAMEACASGIPCILTDIRGCREVVIDKINGFLVPEKNVKLLVKRIKLLLNNPSLRKKMGVKSRERAEKHFDEKILFQKVAKTYEFLLKKTNLE